MSENATLLIELGVEELPAGSVQSMSEFLGAELKKFCMKLGSIPVMCRSMQLREDWQR